MHIQALESLNKKDMTEIKSYAKPPTLVEKVMEAVMILRGQDPTWSEAKRQLGNSQSTGYGDVFTLVPMFLFASVLVFIPLLHYCWGFTQFIWCGVSNQRVYVYDPRILGYFPRHFCFCSFTCFMWKLHCALNAMFLCEVWVIHQTWQRFFWLLLPFG